MKYILKKMEGKKIEKQFLYVVFPTRDTVEKLYQQKVGLKGKISYKIVGKKGFGYDPIFIPIGKTITFGQMNKSKKIKMDHRFIAFQKLKKD